MSKDDTAVNTEATAETATTESAPVENESAAEQDDLMEASLDDLESEAEETEGKQAPEKTQETTEETTPQENQEGEKQLSPKSENRFQKLANENREMREQLLRLQSQETQVAAEQDLLNQINPQTGDYYTAAEAERMARLQANEGLQQQLAQERYQIEVQQNQQMISSEAGRVLQDFPIFDEKSPEYRPEIAQQFDQLLGQSIIADNNGTIVGASLSPYQLAKTIADSIGIGTTQGQVKAQKAQQQMLANADVTPNAPQSKSKVDPMLQAFDEEAGF